MIEAVIATATTNGRPLVKCAIVVTTPIKPIGTKNTAATITRAYITSFPTTRAAIRSTSLSLNCWPTAMLYHWPCSQADDRRYVLRTAARSFSAASVAAFACSPETRPNTSYVAWDLIRRAISSSVLNLANSADSRG